MATNNRIGIPVNLPTGATHDILVINHPDGYPEGRLEFKFMDAPRKITGLQKVAQLFLKILLTRKGSDVINFNLGTLFPDYAINANRTGVDRDLYIAVTNEIKEAERQCKTILNTVDADDASTLEKVTILGLDTSNESIILYVKLTTLAGAGAQVAVPFPELDITLSEA